MEFRTVNNNFKVIDSDTVLAVIDDNIACQIRCGEADWHLLQKKAVSVPRYQTEKWHLKEIVSDIYQWTLPYNSFLGYMYGVLSIDNTTKQ